MEVTRYILQGGGEHARVVLDSLLASGTEVLALFDPKYNDELFGVPQKGTYDPAFAPDALAIVAIGDNRTRKKVVLETRHPFGKVVHPSAIVSPFASLQEGCMILQGAIVQARASVGKHVIVNTGAQVDHDCVIGNFVHIGPGSCLSGCVEVGEGAFIGAGSVVIPGKKIGPWSTVGAGAVVIHDVPPNTTVVGNPARIIKNG